MITEEGRRLECLGSLEQTTPNPFPSVAGPHTNRHPLKAAFFVVFSQITTLKQSQHFLSFSVSCYIFHALFPLQKL